MDTQHEPILAVFDFDGTITTKDTLFDFLFFYFGKTKVLWGIFTLSPILILYKLGLASNNKAKEILFSHFFKNKNISEFNDVCNQYVNRINSILKPDIMAKVQWHQAQNSPVLIVSASIVNWIEPWAITEGFSQVIGTEIEVKNNLITGKFSTPNCYGQEKVNRLLAVYPCKDSYFLYAYGDSAGDKELLKLADCPTLIQD